MRWTWPLLAAVGLALVGGQAHPRIERHTGRHELAAGLRATHVHNHHHALAARRHHRGGTLALPVRRLLLDRFDTVTTLAMRAPARAHLVARPSARSSRGPPCS